MLHKCRGDFVRTMKCGWLWWTGHVATMAETRNVYRGLVAKPLQTVEVHMEMGGGGGRRFKWRSDANENGSGSYALVGFVMNLQALSWRFINSILLKFSLKYVGSRTNEFFPHLSITRNFGSPGSEQIPASFSKFILKLWRLPSLTYLTVHSRLSD